jgi:hypothetical protein
MKKILVAVDGSAASLKADRLTHICKKLVVR